MVENVIARKTSFREGPIVKILTFLDKIIV